ncbi:Hypothetical protein, predicted lipoprotein [Metamycoplasma auris 15026]|uniref:Lipoprotein n=1 Tax=Metamycoplasma auris 15026 TaxID=1188233 RepID=N9V1N2_9BACT|nr:variable surface lipoprotein [Metamycoplasma auris]ENY69287.1 Hypothetical protein, predicted lipoprotein [Metamycoplasma auris 15026]
MKKNIKFLALAASIIPIALPILAASCNTKEPKEKKEFKELISRLEKETSKDNNLDAKTKLELEKLFSDARLELNKLKTSDEFKKAIETLKNKIEETKKENKNETSTSSSNTNKENNDSDISKKYKMPELYEYSKKGNLFEITNKETLKDELEAILKNNKFGAITIDKGVIKFGTRSNLKEVKSFQINSSLKNKENINTHGSTNHNIGWHFKGGGVRKGIYLKKEKENKYSLHWKLITIKDNKVTKEEKEYIEVFEIK